MRFEFYDTIQKKTEVSIGKLKSPRLIKHKM